MCAKDRSHIAVRSQTDSIHSMREMLNISSCPAFIRDSRGEVIHTSPTFDKIFLTSGELEHLIHPEHLEAGFWISHWRSNWN